MLKFYQEKVAAYQSKLQKLNKKVNFIVFMRLIAFLMIFAALVLLSSKGNPMLVWLLLFITITAFLYLIKHHQKLLVQKKYFEKLIDINNTEIQVLHNNYIHLYNGEEYAEHKHAYSSDLNILGHASIFQYLNRTVSKTGTDSLIQSLLHPDLNVDNIKKDQEVYRELKEKPEWRQKFQCLGADISNKKDELQSFKDWLLEAPVVSQKKVLKFFTRYSPFVAFALLAYGIYSGTYIFAEIIFGVQLLITLFYARPINKIHERLNNQFVTLDSYSKLMDHIANEDFTSSRLIDARKKLSKDQENASKQMKKLAGILNALDRRMNVIAAFFLNTAYMADLQNVLQLEKWKIFNKEHVDEWFNAIAIFDKGISFATFAFNNPKYVFPEVSNENIILAKDLGHPSIPAHKRICNNFSIKNEGEFVILTGANMAGKSTFLRTVGVNLVLAMNGAPVCASTFIFKPIKIMTSISVKDSLFENESYFYAELLRLKSIIESLESGESIFIILDEILKGTNSNDKLSGSFSLMKKLIGFKACGIVATHDIALGEMEKEFPDNIHNFSFEVSLENDKLFYDYKLQKGSCKNLNASFLMRKMGITN